MNHDRLKAKLLEKINDKREEMIEIAIKEGYTSEMAVNCSQDLDMLLNEYQLILIEEKAMAARPLYDLVHSMKMWNIGDSVHYS